MEEQGEKWQEGEAVMTLVLEWDVWLTSQVVSRWMISREEGGEEGTSEDNEWRAEPQVRWRLWGKIGRRRG